MEAFTMLFPKVSGSNLDRVHFSLPQDFEGELNLLLIPFQQWQQRVVDTWIPAAQALEARHTGVRYYELPTIRRMGPLRRTFINEGMRAGIPDPVARERTITLYLDKTSFRQALELEDEDTVYALLVDRDGQVLWRSSGEYTPAKGVALEQILVAQVPGRLEQTVA
jgi:hypothetical protein